MGVVKANNELRELQAKEEKEIDRILAELSAEAASFREDITLNYDLLIRLDSIFARGKLSARMGAGAVRQKPLPAPGPAPPAAPQDGGGQ